MYRLKSSKKSAAINTIDVIISARRVADLAESDGLDINHSFSRSSCQHLGAVLADSVLQSGLNYSTVVKPRISRILKEYEHANNTSELILIIKTGNTSEFLNWQHMTKITRFEELVISIHELGIENSMELRKRLDEESFCRSLQEISGIGPKTVDYMSCLLGIESVAVDRHIRNYAKRAGVVETDYNFLKRVFCFAADFLQIPRRNFDSWIWQQESTKNGRQLSISF